MFAIARNVQKTQHTHHHQQQHVPVSPNPRNPNIGNQGNTLTPPKPLSPSEIALSQRREITHSMKYPTAFHKGIRIFRIMSTPSREIEISFGDIYGLIPYPLEEMICFWIFILIVLIIVFPVAPIILFILLIVYLSDGFKVIGKRISLNKETGKIIYEELKKKELIVEKRKVINIRDVVSVTVETKKKVLTQQGHVPRFPIWICLNYSEGKEVKELRLIEGNETQNGGEMEKYEDLAIHICSYLVEMKNKWITSDRYVPPTVQLDSGSTGFLCENDGGSAVKMDRFRIIKMESFMKLSFRQKNIEPQKYVVHKVPVNHPVAVQPSHIQQQQQQQQQQQHQHQQQHQQQQQQQQYQQQQQQQQYQQQQQQQQYQQQQQQQQYQQQQQQQYQQQQQQQYQQQQPVNIQHPQIVATPQKQQQQQPINIVQNPQQIVVIPQKPQQIVVQPQQIVIPQKPQQIEFVQQVNNSQQPIIIQSNQIVSTGNVIIQ